MVRVALSELEPWPWDCSRSLTDDGLAAEPTVKGTKYYRDEGLNN